MAKNFSIIENEQGVYNTISEATAQGRKPRKGNYTEEEKAEAVNCANQIEKWQTKQAAHLQKMQGLKGEYRALDTLEKEMTKKPLPARPKKGRKK